MDTRDRCRWANLAEAYYVLTGAVPDHAGR